MGVAATPPAVAVTSRTNDDANREFAARGLPSFRFPFDSLAGSSAVADDFNVKNGVYKAKQDVKTYVDAKLTAEAMAAAKK